MKYEIVVFDEVEMFFESIAENVDEEDVNKELKVFFSDDEKDFETVYKSTTITVLSCNDQKIIVMRDDVDKNIIKICKAILGI
jgi:hypothetical protein